MTQGKERKWGEKEKKRELKALLVLDDDIEVDSEEYRNQIP